MGYYISQSDLEARFGTNNISAAGGWADVNNDGDTDTIETTITNAISFGETLMDAKLRGGRWKVPLVGTDYQSEVVKFICTAFAGEYLYSARALYDEPNPKLLSLVDRAATYLAMIRGGQIQLQLTRSHSAPDVPIAFETL